MTVDDPSRFTVDAIDAERKDATTRLDLLTPTELAELLKVKKSWIYDEVERGRLPALRLNRQLRFRVRDVVAYLDDACEA
jgi:excisionase family DNA binding protein